MARMKGNEKKRKRERKIEKKGRYLDKETSEKLNRNRKSETKAEQKKRANNNTHTHTHTHTKTAELVSKFLEHLQKPFTLITSCSLRVNHSKHETKSRNWF